MKNYCFYKKLILRTPALPKNFNNVEITEKELSKYIQEALYIASPSLNKTINTAESLSDKDKDKLKITLRKYISRMSNRCTPFGLFAGCSVINIDKNTNIVLDENIVRHTRISMDYLYRVFTKLSGLTTFREKVKYFPNPTIYYTQKSLKYTECIYKNNVKYHELCIVERNKDLDLILDLARNGIYILDLLNILDKNKYSDGSDSFEFINIIIDNQLLVSELEPNITGEYYFSRMINFLKNVEIGETETSPISDIRKILCKVSEQLSQLDKQVNDKKNYEDIINNLSILDIPCEEGQYFQVDMFKPCIDGALSENILNKVKFGCEILLKLSNGKRKNNSIVKWIERFKERYGEARISLLEALDPELGLGYSEYERCYMPLLKDISFKQNGLVQEKESILEELFRTKYANIFSHDTLILEDKDFQNIIFSDKDLPYSMSAVFQVVSDDKIFLKGFSNVSYIGRFTSLDDSIDEIYKDLIKIESQCASPALLAEVLHIPQPKFGNIMHRKTSREYEIPIFSTPSVSKNKQIELTDLYLKMQKDKLVLYSKSRNIEILPRISNAYNFNIQAIPVFKFLNDIQEQNGNNSYWFNWEEMEQKTTFLPRVEINNVILSPRTWIFKEKQISELTNSLSEPEKFELFRKRYNFPHIAVFQESDNELLINFNKAIDRNIFFNIVKNKDKVVFIEYLFEAKNLVVNENSEGFSNEFIAFLYRNPEINSDSNEFHNKAIDKVDNYNFKLGTEWLFFKIFTSPKASDKVLKELILPLVQELKNKVLIKSWFFIRYNTPEYHIRLRLNLKNKDCNGQIIDLFNLYSHKLDRQIFNVQIDTYQREVERYGGKHMLLSEELFYYDSEAVLKIVSILKGNDGENTRWKLGLVGIDFFLNDFELNIEDKINLLNELRVAYFEEFKVDKVFLKYLNSFYEKNKDEINNFVNNLTTNNSLNDFIDILKERSNKSQKTILNMKKIANKNKIINLIKSHIHMFLNRLIIDTPREHELIIYDIMSRQYRSIYHRRDQKEKTIIQ